MNPPTTISIYQAPEYNRFGLIDDDFVKNISYDNGFGSHVNTAGIIVVNNGHVLLVKERSRVCNEIDGIDLIAPRHGFPKGRKEDICDKTSLDTALRELQEETGIILPHKTRILPLALLDFKDRYTALFFIAVIPADAMPILPNIPLPETAVNEIDSVGWFKWDQLPEDMNNVSSELMKTINKIGIANSYIVPA